ncbi:MAG: DUF3854 domain-containing protein [Nostoc sp.]|uniref:DUF3854 domain-containing protein n=1 Tax=Nostoc sp. TaxID=1180 RepID=UPI002FFD2E09
MGVDPTGKVRTAIRCMGRLLVADSCSLRAIDLPFGQEKGVDDFIVTKGQSAFDTLYNTAVALELWEIKLFTALTYPPAMSATGYAYALNQRFLGQLSSRLSPQVKNCILDISRNQLRPLSKPLPVGVSLPLGKRREA